MWVKIWLLGFFQKYHKTFGMSAPKHFWKFVKPDAFPENELSLMRFQNMQRNVMNASENVNKWFQGPYTTGIDNNNEHYNPILKDYRYKPIPESNWSTEHSWKTGCLDNSRSIVSHSYLKLSCSISPDIEKLNIM